MGYAMEAALLPEKDTDSCAVARCVHCGEECALGEKYCCAGCQAASTLMENTSPYIAFVKEGEEGEHQLTLRVEGIHCASCIQLIENALLEEEAMTHARVNMSTKRLAFSWNGEASLADYFVKKVENLGYKLHAFDESKTSHSNEERTLLRCIAVAGFAMGNIMLLSVVLWSSDAKVMGMATRDLLHFISALIAIPAIAYAGQPFFHSAYRVLKSGHTNMDVPISLAVCLASGMSLWEVFRSGEYIYFDSAVMLLFFLLIGRYLDARAKGKARESAQELLAMLEGTALIIENNKERRIPIKALREGMVVSIAMGEKVPADCVILEGVSELDMSLINGETIPKSVGKGDRIFAGTINLSAPLRCEVAKASEDSLLSDIVKLMEKAEQGQARYVRLADKAARLYTPVVHSLGLLTFLGWWLAMGIAWQEALMIAVTVLIITCPCALGLAVPVVQVLASGKLMRQGILLKSGDALEKLAAITQVIFDKTGTLTLGQPVLLHSPLVGESKSPSVAKDDWVGGGDSLKLATSLASHSRHPYSRAICDAYEGELIAPLEAVEEVAGKGLQAFYEGKNIRLGKAEWCGQKKIKSELPQIWLAIEGEEPVAFQFIDPLRDDAKETVEKFDKENLMVRLLSGDRSSVVQAVAQQLNIDHWQAELSPIDKTRMVQQYEERGEKCLMVGDGLNDAPALASASVSLSPASAIDITQNTADIVFQGNSLSPVFIAWKMAKRATQLVKQNFALAVCYNLIAIPLAVMGYVTPLIAALAMSGSSLLVIANSFRLNRG